MHSFRINSFARGVSALLPSLLAQRPVHLVHRRGLSLSATRALRQPQPPTTGDAHDSSDFVDVGAFPLEGAASSALSASETAVLGVTRRVLPKEGTEFSRFAIPLEVPRRGEPIPRPNSRAVFKPGEEARLTEAQRKHQTAHVKNAAHQQGDDAGGATPAASSSAHAKEQVTEEEEEPEDMALALANALVADSQGIHGDEESGHGSFSPLPQPDTSLPYDDETFAETLLQMEVDGVIDEAWQDTRKAHLEDIKEVTEILKSLKVRDICCIDVSGKTGNFDYMLFGTCEGPRHIHLAAWAAQEADSLKRVSKIPRKKTDELWEVVPIGRIVLNLMVESLRDELTLERKWAVTRTMDPLEAANAPVSEGRNVRAHGLWTLTLNLQDLEDFEVDYCKDVLLRQV